MDLFYKKKMYQPKEIAVYIHWPFCKSKCPYCDFYKEVARNVNQEAIIDEYLAALQKYGDLLGARVVKSIFFGGGTPSLIKPQNVEKIIAKITELWPLKVNVEISLEANPNTNYQNMFKDLKSAGINRISIGVQSLDEDNLRFLGRTHNLQTARECLREAVAVFANNSADLMYALPKQNLNSWQNELEEICSYGLKHISLYQLTIEENTVFARKQIKPLDDEDAVQMYDFTRDFLADKGYLQYEVSNFAQKNYESVHNLTYWQGGDYIGIGKSAHGRIFMNGKHYATEYPFMHTQISNEERAQELVIMGLRLTQGIDKAEFKQICGFAFDDFVNQEKKQKLKELGLVDETSSHFFATYQGILLLNQIIYELCS